MEGTVRRVCFFYFSVTATFLLLFLLLSSSLWFLADLLQVLLFSSPLMFDFVLFLFIFVEWMEIARKKKKIQNLKNSKLHFSFPFISFFLSKRDPSMILNARKCNEFICLYYHFDFLFIWFEFKFLSLHFLLFHSFFSFILSFLQCSICLFWMIVSRIYCPMLLQLGRRLFRIALEKEN